MSNVVFSLFAVRLTLCFSSFFDTWSIFYLSYCLSYLQGGFVCFFYISFFPALSCLPLLLLFFIHRVSLISSCPFLFMSTGSNLTLGGICIAGKRCFRFSFLVLVYLSWRYGICMLEVINFHVQKFPSLRKISIIQRVNSSLLVSIFFFLDVLVALLLSPVHHAFKL